MYYPHPTLQFIATKFMGILKLNKGVLLQEVVILIVLELKKAEHREF
jgi:hypothetical protein